jgi:hypothetical protein
MRKNITPPVFSSHCHPPSPPPQSHHTIDQVIGSIVSTSETYTLKVTGICIQRYTFAQCWCGASGHLRTSSYSTSSPIRSHLPAPYQTQSLNLDGSNAIIITLRLMTFTLIHFQDRSLDAIIRVKDRLGVERRLGCTRQNYPT